MSDVITTLSTKGQVIVPAETRRRLGWRAGTRLIVEDTPDGVLLKSAPIFAPTRLEDVAGMLRYDGPAKAIEEMDASIIEEVRRRHASGRY
jgi:AbrB family looped-hinge helix DNA binding protein